MNQTFNEALIQAVSDFDYEKVMQCLESGADPNWLRTGLDYPDIQVMQPDTPLKMLVFRISDHFLTEEDLQEYKKILELLLQYGANTSEAIRMSEERYGVYSESWEKNVFQEIIERLVKAS